MGYHSRIAERVAKSSGGITETRFEKHPFPVRHQANHLVKENELYSFPTRRIFHSRMFHLWDPESLAAYETVCNGCADGEYHMVRVIEPVWCDEQKDYFVRLEWTEIYIDASKPPPPQG